MELFRRDFAVNLLETFDMVRQCGFRMSTNEPDADNLRGVIVNTVSAAATDGQIDKAAYAASKTGVVRMTLPVARNLSGMDIRFGTISPDIFRHTAAENCSLGGESRVTGRVDPGSQVTERSGRLFHAGRTDCPQ